MRARTFGHNDIYFDRSGYASEIDAHALGVCCRHYVAEGELADVLFSQLWAKNHISLKMAQSPYSLVKEVLRTLGLTPYVITFLTYCGLRKREQHWFEQCLALIETNGRRISQFNVLDVFAGDGTNTARFYYRKVKSGTLWDIDETRVSKSQSLYPRFQVKQTNSFVEIVGHRAKHDLIVCDNNIKVYGEYCEHFELFEHLFDVCNDDCVILFNVFPALPEELRAKYYCYFTDEHISRRRQFYNTTTPYSIPLPELERFYRNMAREHGYSTAFFHTIKRPEVSGMIFGCIMGLSKTKATSTLDRSGNGG